MSKAAFARLAKKTPQAVGQATRQGGRLSGALTANGKIDSNHPEARQFLEAFGVTVESKPSGADGREPRIQFSDNVDAEDIDDLKAQKLKEEIRWYELRNQETEGSLISRELVEKSILSLVEEQNLRLLNDVAKSIARTVQAQGISGVDLEISERDVRNMIGQTLESTKSKLAKKLREMQS